jgi:poly(3-hydroxybutyrate) depolymerase
MRKFNSILFLFIILFSVALSAQKSYPKSTGEYKQVVEGFDWGPAVNKVILSIDDTTSRLNGSDFSVFVTRNSSEGGISADQSSGERNIVTAYISDDHANKVVTGKYITLVLNVGPNLPLSSPFQYSWKKGNQWVDYQFHIINHKTFDVWSKSTGKIMPLVDQFDLKGKFTYNEKLTMSYASFIPSNQKEKSPLIIWLHGGGEGGFDPTTALLGNKAANYASEAIQSVFEGAYVLVPQSPTFWMQNSEGSYTTGKVNDVYNEALMALIKDYVKSNPKVDASRIYVGGCSNGGYMSLKLILLHPEYFAAAYISSLAYSAEYITDEEIQKIKNIPIWFVHSKDDATTKPNETVLPVYQRLIAAGAKNVHFSFYDHVYDITNIYGGKGYQYPGHWSWVYVHENLPRQDFNESLVKLNGKPVTIMEWMAAQKIAPKK